MVLPKLIADLEVSNLSSVSPAGEQEPGPSSSPSQDLQGPSAPSTSPAPVRDSASLPALSITCFGRFEVKRLGQPVALCTSRNRRSILRFLVAKSGYSATSDTLKALLWAEEEPEVAQRKLHHAISALRRSLDGSPPSESNGGYIVCKNGIYALNPTVKIQTDVDEFLDCYRMGQQTSEERVVWYERACCLYTGPFLTEDMYADWSSLQREQLSKTYFAMCRVLADHYLRIKRYEDAMRWVTAILQENRCDESAHQQLIQIYIAQGHRSEAIQQYQRCERILREELGVQPLPETTQLLQTHLLPPVECPRSKNGEEM
jgi:DNA-binding SARP family transcriptional activator